MHEYLHQNCFFYKDRTLTAGWVEGIQKKKLIIAPLQGKSLLLPPHRVRIFWSATATEKHSALAALQNQMPQIAEIAQAQDLETIHALIGGEESHTLEDLVANFLEPSGTPLLRVGLFFALENDPHFFKKKGTLYAPRTSEEMAQLEARQKQMEQQKQWEAQSRKWIEAIEGGRWNAQTVQNEEQSQWVKQLQGVLIYGKDSGYWKTLAPVFNLSMPLSPEEELKLRRLLQQIGCPISQSRLIGLRASVKEGFSQKTLDAAQQITQTPLWSKDRKSWSHAPPVTVDAETTQDYDDAFSILDWTDEQVEIVLHIADLSSTIAPQNPLFATAEHRVASVYTVEQTFPMLPPALSNDYFSLKAGEDRFAMSFAFQLSINGEKKFRGIDLSVVHVEENMTYDQADEAIAQGLSFWPTLSNCCLALRQKRVEGGALDFMRQEVKIDIRDPERIAIVPLDRNTAANELVEELAILVNQAVGEFFYERQCPGIYRVQSPYEKVGEAPAGEPLTPQHFIIEPVRLSTVPERHAGLGCDHYIQATSPIRRFSDLVSQLQLNRLVTGEALFFPEEQLMGWAEQIQNVQRMYGRAEREIEDYWKYQYLRQQQGELFVATIKRQFRAGKTEVEFEAIQLTTQLPQLSQFELKEKVLLKIENVDAERRLIVASVETTKPLA